MTVRERVLQTVDNMDCETDNIDKIIALAYYMGRESAAKEVCDKAAKIFDKQLKAADSCRYHNMVRKIQGNITYIYHGDYAQTMTIEFGTDNTCL